MISPIRIDRERQMIIINSAFARKADQFNTQEYSMLQECKRDYPSYRVMTRRIKTNPERESYKGLTYSYMENYILTHDPRAKDVLYEFAQLKTQAQCHSRRYSVIKKWFLNKYPEITEFGIPESELIESSVA